MKKLWNIFTSALVVLAVLLALLLVGARLVGLQVFTVLSGSMEPTYHTGSLIYVKKVDATKLSEGTVITFMLDEDTIATHRIVGVVPDEEDPSVVRYRTKGDANENEDGGLVHYKNVVGTPVFTIPKLGYLANYIQHPPGTYVAISAGALILLLMFLPELLGMLTGDEKKQAPAAPNRSPAKRVRLGKEEGRSEVQLSSSEGSEMKRVSSDAEKRRRSKKKAAPQPPVREPASRTPAAPNRSPDPSLPLEGKVPSAHTGRMRWESPRIARPQNEASSPLPQNRPEAQQSGLETERKKRVSSATESSEVPLPPPEKKTVRRVSSPAPERSQAKHVSSHAAASTAKSPKRKGGAHCAK